MIGGIHVDQIGIQAVLEHLDDTFGFVLTHQTMVDMDTDQLLADCLDQQGGNHTGVNAAGQGQQDLLIANLGANLGDLLVDESLSKLRSGDACHGFGTYIIRHK